MIGIELPIRLNLQEATHINEATYKNIMKTSFNDLTTAYATFMQNYETLPLSSWSDDTTVDKWETKAKTQKDMVRMQKINSICHEIFTYVYEVKQTAIRHGKKDISEKECWKHLRESKWKLEEAIVALKLPFNTQPYLKEADFGPREYTKAALLNEDNGYLASAGDAPFKNAEEIFALISDVDTSPAKLVPIEKRDGEQERVIIKDCVRTFAGHDHQRRLEDFLHGAYLEFDNYSQGMAHVAAFLLLSLEEDKVIQIIRKINYDIIPSHWKHESDGFGASAYVFRDILKKHDSEVFEHLEKYHLLPEVYSRKWMCGLGLHCLDLELVYRFLKNLLKRNFEYLIAFGMAIVKHLRDRIIEETNPGVLIDILALDSAKAGIEREDQEAILDLADTLSFGKDLGPDRKAIDIYREEMFNKFLKERLEKAKEALAAAEDDEDWCQDCEQGPARWVDEDEDGILICDFCRPKHDALGHEITEW